MGHAAVIVDDIPRIYTAFAEWMACMLLLPHIKQRLRGWLLAVGAAVFLIFQSVFLYLTDDADQFLWILCMLIAIGAMGLFLWKVFLCSKNTALFYTAEALLLAEFTAALQWMLRCFYIDVFSARSLTEVLSFLWVFGGIAAFISWLNGYLNDNGRMLIPSPRETWTAVIICLVTFVASNLSFLLANTPLSGTQYAVLQLRTLIDLAGLTILCAYHLQIKNSRYELEMSKMEMLLMNQYQQYTQSREVQDNINYKYHDLKQYIAVMRQGTPARQQEEVLDRIESEIRDYEAQSNTGNAVLDTLLSTKGITCRNQHILLTTVADGSLLDFMETIDICSIFGNALDNAIEYEMKVSDPDKRMINLSVLARNNAFLVILCENYYEGNDDPGLRDTLPGTTKTNKNLHGYGLLSMQQAVHKYEGEMILETKDNWFRLRILIPIHQDEKADPKSSG